MKADYIIWTDDFDKFRILNFVSEQAMNICNIPGNYTVDEVHQTGIEDERGKRGGGKKREKLGRLEGAENERLELKYGLC